MITLADVQTQSHWVLGLSFFLAVLAGGVLHRSHFCTMGALSDIFLMGSATRLRQWVLTVAVAILGFGAMAGLGLISPQNTIYANTSLSFVSLGLGGLLFGSGMVLASGCISKSLTRLGAGNLKSLVVLLVVGVSALATMRGLPAVWRVHALDPISLPLSHGAFVGQWVTHWTGWTLASASGVSAGFVGALLLLWVFKDASFRSWRDAWPGLAVGSCVVVAWWVSGVLGFVSEHPETLDTVFLTTASARMEAISMTAPVALWWDAWMYFSDGSKRLTLGMVWVPGLILGSFLSASHEGSFRWEGFTQTPDLVSHLLGGVLMGVGGVLAMGCTFGQGLSGLSTLSWGSMLAVAGMVLGAWLTFQWQMRRAEALA
ncbi:YeeE/YedE thiosulfate transporter family protein [Limnohabitans sp. WS1]|uniref:YeeE/YedE thiosulfate transporter family protein n=1 Tax=Limnohabitans sp. WS1 TaxID=1100726 RepID=UPI001E588F23|nr:YeeE/YedE thiosulfate transporter family protein [Limnohabitans sp. WS1]